MSHTNSFESGKKLDYAKSQNTLNIINFIFWAKSGRLTSAILIVSGTRHPNLKVHIVYHTLFVENKHTKLNYHYKELCMIKT